MNFKLGAILFLSISLFQGCIKKEQKITDEGQIMKMLNESDGEAALIKINALLATDPNNKELLYLKASALSMNAGVDVYKLFPLLKAKIFNVAITQWSEQRQFEKRINERREGDISTGSEDGQELKYKPLDPKTIEFEFQYAYAFVDDREHQKPDAKVLIEIIVKSKQLSNSPHDLFTLIFETTLENIYIKAFKKVINEGNDYYFEVLDKSAPTTTLLNDLIVTLIEKEHFHIWEEKYKKIQSKQNQVNAIRALWSITDMIPLIKEIPKIDKKALSRLEEAQKILIELIQQNSLNKDESYDKYRKQLMMISALKLISRFQDGFDLTNVKSPYDLICQNNSQTAEILLDTHEDLLLILQGVEDEKIKEKNDAIFKEVETELKDLNDKLKINGQYKNSNITFREHVVDALRTSLDSMAKDNCMKDN